MDASDAEQAAERERADSLERIRRGGLPLRAEQRLKDLAAHGGFFTSDLSISEFHLCQQAGLRPISQVMGSCVYQVGYTGRPYYYGASAYSGRAIGTEMGSLSEAWNAARQHALSRLRQEAQHCQADAVIGVHITKGAWDFVAGAIEFVAVGTAVRHEGERPNPTPVLTDLSVQDYFKLRQAGYDALGVVGATTVYYVIPSIASQQVQGTRLWGPGSRNQELSDLTQGLYAARELAMSRVESAARSLHAAGVVGVSFEQSIRTFEAQNTAFTGFGGGSHSDLQITLHVMGTAIAQQRRGADVGPGGLAVTPVIRLSR